MILSSKAEIASEHPQVGMTPPLPSPGSAVTLPSMQRAARHLSRKVPFILVRVALSGAFVW